jgi:hypothetical protein
MCMTDDETTDYAVSVAKSKNPHMRSGRKPEWKDLGEIRNIIHAWKPTKAPVIHSVY